jgi:hypothetical protein
MAARRVGTHGERLRVREGQAPLLSRDRDSPTSKEKSIMLETIAVILVVLWLLGLVTSTTMGGLIHLLLVVAIVVVLIRVIQGRRV